MASSLQDVEQMSNQVLTIVGQSGKQSIHREWERVQVKSHQIHTTILKVELTNRMRRFISFDFDIDLDRTTITKLYYRLFNILERERTIIT